MRIRIKCRTSYEPNCIVCGVDNPIGIGARFYETEDGRILGVFTARDTHRSYPNTLHGGVSAAILDDCIGRAIKLSAPQYWGLTVDLHLTYKKPVPCNAECWCLGELTDIGGRVYSCRGEIIIPDGQTAVIAEGKYYKVEEAALIEKEDVSDYSMQVEATPCPEYIDIPGEH